MQRYKYFIIKIYNMAIKVSVFKLGKGKAIILPSKICELLEIKVGNKLLLDLENRKIILKKEK